MSSQAAAVEALALIRDSSPYRNAGGHLADAWARWEAANPNEHALLDAYVAGTTAAPALSTKFGKGWAALIAGSGNSVVQPTPEPARKLLKGAIVVTAGNMNVDLLRQAGVTHVAVELNAANMSDFGTPRWDGFTKGWFVVSRGNDGDTLSTTLFAYTNVIRFAVVDTESHKTDTGGSLAWTDTLYAALRSKLGAAFPLYNITFGIHSSPAVVNHVAFRRHNVTPIWEAYDGNGATLGVGRTALKAADEGWPNPHLAVGDKSLREDAAMLAASSAWNPVVRPGGVWAWAPEQAGDSLLALRGLA